MKIALITARVVYTDGQGRVNLELARHLAIAGHQVTVISSECDPGLAALPGVRWLRVPVPAMLKPALLRDQLFAVAARSLLARAGGFDIVHANGFSMWGAADVNTSHFVHAAHLKAGSTASGGAWWRRAYRHLYARVNATLERRAYRAARRVVAVSGAVRHELVRDGGVDGTRVDVIGNGVDPDLFRPRAHGDPDALRDELRLPADAFVVCFVGDLRTNRKNLDLPLRALGRLPARVVLAVIGDPQGSPYPSLARTLGVAARVHFLGHRSDVSQLMRGADACVFPSRYDPFGLVVLEAMASGVPVVTTPATGAAALIRSGDNGFVLRDCDDQDGLVSTLAALGSDPALHARVARAGRATALANTWSAVGRSYQDLYQRISRR